MDKWRSGARYPNGICLAWIKPSKPSAATEISSEQIIDKCSCLISILLGSAEIFFNGIFEHVSEWHKNKPRCLGARISFGESDLCAVPSCASSPSSTTTAYSKSCEPCLTHPVPNRFLNWVNWLTARQNQGKTFKTFTGLFCFLVVQTTQKLKGNKIYQSDNNDLVFHKHAN